MCVSARLSFLAIRVVGGVQCKISDPFLRMCGYAIRPLSPLSCGLITSHTASYGDIYGRVQLTVMRWVWYENTKINDFAVSGRLFGRFFRSLLLMFD